MMKYFSLRRMRQKKYFLIAMGTIIVILLTKLMITGGKSFRIVKWSNSYQPAINNRRIYFHETSSHIRNLNFRQTCAIESAAKHNPSRSIQLFLRKEKMDLTVIATSLEPNWLTALQNYPNIEVLLIDETEYFEHTPLESW